MTQITPKTTSSEPNRYSPKPREAYEKTSNGRKTYTAASCQLIEDVATWNLTYLSHDIESMTMHSDPAFHVLVRRTIQTQLDGSGPDLTRMSDSKTRIEHWLTLPAPRFVHLVRQHPHLKSVPLYQAYGEAWLKLIENRSWLCQFQPEAEPDPLRDPFANLEDARLVLSRVMAS
jgi:hypothetical protein